MIKESFQKLMYKKNELPSQKSDEKQEKSNHFSHDLLPFGAKMEKVDKILKRKKRYLKKLQKEKNPRDAFNHFFSTENKVPLPVTTKNPRAVKRLNRSFERKKSNKALETHPNL